MLKPGERQTLDDGRVIEFVDRLSGDMCIKCILRESNSECLRHPCMPHERDDGLDGYYREVKE